MVLLPLLGAILQAFVGPSRDAVGGARGQMSLWIALGASLASTLCGIILVWSMAGQGPEVAANEVLPWVGSFAISYDMAVDGLNVLPVLLIAIIFPLLVASEWKQKQGRRGIQGLLLVLQASLAGTVCAQDLFLLFFFWALSALPFYFLIGIWGGQNRQVSAFRFITVSTIGNALLFGALILLYYAGDPHSFSLKDLAGGKVELETFRLLGQPLPVASVAFGLISAGLALRAPVWPLHSWFTQAADEAPPSVFVALCAVAVPVATYIFIRLSYSLFPATLEHAAEAVVVIGSISLVIGGFSALAQRNLRSLLAYICLSGVGLILIGLGSRNTVGVVGAIYQQLALGLGLAGFGLFSGILHRRTGRTEFVDLQGNSTLGGVAIQAPVMALVAGVIIASLLGFPGLGGFVGQGLLLIGSFSSHPVAVLIAGASLLLATYYLFQMFRFVFLGQPVNGGTELEDLSLWERAYLLPLVGCLLLFGLYPKPLIELVRPSVQSLISTVK